MTTEEQLAALVKSAFQEGYLLGAGREPSETVEQLWERRNWPARIHEYLSPPEPEPDWPEDFPGFPIIIFDGTRPLLIEDECFCTESLHRHCGSRSWYGSDSWYADDSPTLVTELLLAVKLGYWAHPGELTDEQLGWIADGEEQGQKFITEWAAGRRRQPTT